MDIQALVQNELKNIHRSRNRIAYIPTTLILWVSVYIQRGFGDLKGFLLASLITSVAAITLRLLTYEVFFEQWKKGHKGVLALNLVTFFLQALSWGLHFTDIYTHFGADSSNTSYTLMLMVSYVTSASISLGASKSTYLTFVITMGLSVIACNIFAFDEVNYISIFIVTLFLFFSLTNNRVAYRQLCELIHSRISANYEKERLIGFVNTVPGFVGLLDKDGVCYLANKTTLNLYPNIIGKKIGALDHTSRWEQYVLEFLSSDKKNDISEQKTSITGKDIHALLNLQKMEDGGVIIVSILTTELVEARKRIREQEAQSHYTAKLASLGEMAAGIAHEINNPLTIILGSASIMKKLVSEENIDRKMVNTIADKIVDTTGRISKTVKSLKTLSRNAENDPMTSVSVQKVLDVCLDLCQQHFKQNSVELKISESLKDYYVTGREVQIAQVFVNLLNNASDAVRNQTDRWIEIKAKEDGEYLNILVTDSGHGIPKEIQSKIMDPFFTTKDVNQGTGLGLSISKTIVQEHGGELSFLPNEKNTTFAVRLKIAG